MKKIIKISSRQEEILRLLFRFRFLSRPQLQAMLGQKNHSKLLTWLNELTELGYLKRYYDPKLRNVPATYSLGSKSRVYLKELVDKPNLLKRISRESSYTTNFRSHCLDLAELYLQLKKRDETEGVKLRFLTKTDLIGIDYLPYPVPDAYFSFKLGNKPTNYFLEILIGQLKQIKRRIEAYVDYYQTMEWQENESRAFPIIVLINEQQQFTSRLNKYIHSLDSSPKFILTTFEKLPNDLQPKKRANGITNI